ncbi:hypothetical protein PC116_g15055 [Phytophthora cactorum]|uniref:Uncharacterized protein n=1 Tax=Phytophthora cactorum TaxID=29920 RepID=A0A8T1FWT9_9STRA|nr:hypothetical protein PC111_g17715 [Phytophthora cactorum]KAG2821949.1 hypothetical protein PC112_g11154 [Phytophthora cactorum]KAG2856817.1 hypothetical protein PC113_g11242 [Phytophthora cactorum]KAG2981618.1 hypothetical protein PC118_g10501 [Phytophthora cactorum]KAG3174980.1 hypothetical protein C6341_g9658 [Phytophthora cactorum]
MPDAVMEQRWGFLSPWCNVLLYHIHYRALEDDNDGDVWSALQVILPTRTDIYGEYKDDGTFQIEFQNTREALALLAAVARVDYHAYKYLLTNHCGVDVGKIENFEDKIQVHFVLLMEHHAETDLVQLCGVAQRRAISAGYFNSLQRIAAMDCHLKPDKPGFDIEIPVRVFFSSTTVFKANTGPVEILLSIQNAERLIHEEWESYNWSLENQPVDSGQLRCTFVLEPMIGDLGGLGCGTEIAETMAKFVGENVWFSQVSMRAEMDPQREERATLMPFRQTMAVVFDATQRSQELANTRYCSSFVAYHTTSPLQMGRVSMRCDSTLRPSEFESMFSAIVLTKTTRKLTLQMHRNFDNRSDRRDWWKWLAYGCFSERARTHSALESLVLTDIDSMDVADMKDFSAVLSSEHPEEFLFGSPHGAVIERDMALKKGALVQWLLTNKGQPQIGSYPVKFSAVVPYLRTFSDDGKSELVNVMIPGFGRCLVKRTDLVDQQKPQLNTCTYGVKSVTLKFAERSLLNARGGLSRLLAAIGSSLMFLTIDGPGDELYEKVILKHCPNLLELSLRKGWVAVRLNFSEFHARRQSVPKLRFQWHDICGLAADLSKVHDPFTKCVRRLTVNLTNLEVFGYSNWVRYGPALNSYLDALLQMLDVNQTLEYLEVTVPPECHNYRDSFRIHHLRVVNRGRKLSMRTKAAFLSATCISSGVRSSSFKSGKAMKGEHSFSSRPTQCYLDRRVISNIFGFATSPVYRQVYFREKINDDTTSGLC